MPCVPGRSLLILLLCGAVPASAGEAESGPGDYGAQVKPILQARCYACHGSLKQHAGLRLDTGEAIRRGGDGGPAVEPGLADESLLIDRVTSAEPALRMPPEGTPLSAEQVAALRDWIARGADSPADEAPEADPRRHWSFVPPDRPPVPGPRHPGWARNPIDAFLAAEHDRLGLVPPTPAPPQVLIRRLYLDLTGLPPSRSQLHEFLADPSDAAYERIVDRLLASPHHGERWARHWMDVWRYSDWYGRRAVPDVLNSYAMIWRWRDWIVRSLNEDRGYDRMVRAMLAADELAPDDDDDLVATGFLVRNFYRWNYNSWMKDSVEHTGKAFLGLTFNCAHCHDHKYDPIRHEDYFALRAVFEPMELRHDRVPGEPDPGPYPDYVYGSAYAPITSGMVRVFDKTLDAQTFLYTRGESRNVVPGRPPIPPGMPGFLGGASFRVEPIELPDEAAFPGLKAFVRRDEEALRDAALAGAERSLAAARARVESDARMLAVAQAGRVSAVLAAYPGPPSGAPAIVAEAVAAAGLAALHIAAEEGRLALRAAEAGREEALADRDALWARIAADDARFGRAEIEADAEETARAASRAERRASAARAVTALARAELVVAAARSKPPDELAAAEAARDGARSALEAARAKAAEEAADYTPLGPAYPRQSTGRRAALARWITDRANPLTARVAVNHIWRWHFGTPLVATTYDFGRNGAAPSHPELLDWLAVELMEPTTPGASPWSMKALHRLIVTSAAYRMTSHPADPGGENLSIDPENRAYWRFPVNRLEAEEVRDALLHAAGGLDTTFGGPDIDLQGGLTSRRRSLYFTHHAEGRMPFLELFDAPDACDAYRRTTSVVPQQALALVNNSLVLDLSRELADRLWDASGTAGDRGRPEGFLTAAFEQVLSRPPSPRELELSGAFLDRQTHLLTRDPGLDGADAEARARRDLVHALFNHHDFLTVR